MSGVIGHGPPLKAESSADSCGDYAAKTFLR